MWISVDKFSLIPDKVTKKENKTSWKYGPSKEETRKAEFFRDFFREAQMWAWKIVIQVFKNKVVLYILVHIVVIYVVNVM